MRPISSESGKSGPSFGSRVERVVETKEITKHMTWFAKGNKRGWTASIDSVKRFACKTAPVPTLERRSLIFSVCLTNRALLLSDVSAPMCSSAVLKKKDYYNQCGVGYLTGRCCIRIMMQ
jgi:hypothetical protein